MRAMTGMLIGPSFVRQTVERHVKHRPREWIRRIHSVAPRSTGYGPVDERGPRMSAAFEIRTLDNADDMASIVKVFQQVWGTVTPIVNVELLQAISHAGGYVSAVY